MGLESHERAFSDAQTVGGWQIYGQNFQRAGAINNTHVGRVFEDAVQRYWAAKGIDLERCHPVEIGFNAKKAHKFDLGNDEVLVECKSFTWTVGGNSPSAKIRSLNEVMLHFSVTPDRYRKVLFMLRHLRGELSLASHYVKSEGHLIPPDVEVWEFDPDTMDTTQVWPS